MHANRNKKAVKRVEKGMMKANRIRNLFAVFAIVLTTFMITTVFSLGINYMENMKLMQVRTAGTTANASLAMPTEKQEQHHTNGSGERLQVKKNIRIIIYLRRGRRISPRQTGSQSLEVLHGNMYPLSENGICIYLM